MSINRGMDKDVVHVYKGIFSSVQSLSRVRLFATPWITARQASKSITSSWSLPKPMPIELVMSFSHLILCHPLLLLPPIPPSIRVFPMSQLFARGGQSIGVSASASVLPMNIYSAIKRNENVPLAEMWMYLQIVIQSKVSQRKTNIVY